VRPAEVFAGIRVKSLVRARRRDYTWAMPRGRRAGIATALAVAAVAAVTAGCGGGGKSALALDPVAAAATKTQHAGAARIRFSMAVNAPQLQGKTVQIRATGAIDGTSGEMTFDLGSMLQHAGIPAGRSMTEIFLEEDGDFVVYLDLGAALASQIPGGKQWIKLDVSKLGKSAGIDLNQLMSGSQLQPTDLLSILKSEDAQIRKVGPATIGGTATTHYHVVLQMVETIKDRGVSSPMLAAIAAQIPTLPEDVWIGKDGLVRRIKFSVATQAHGKSVQMAMAMDLYDYGANFTIAAPPGSDVFDATQFAQQGLGSAFNQ
jgi:hypothetical protein